MFIIQEVYASTLYINSPLADPILQNRQRSFHIVTASSLTYVADASTVYRALGGTPGAICYS